MVICLGEGADLHMVQLMPLPLTVFCSRLVLHFWYQLIWVVLDKWPLNGVLLLLLSESHRVIKCAAGVGLRVSMTVHFL